MNGYKAPSLQELVGENLVAAIQIIDEKHPSLVKLLAVENGGIWVESQKITDDWLSKIGSFATRKAYIFFVPYQQISWILDRADCPGLSEKALGL
jgi:hypothetical protein